MNRVARLACLLAVASCTNSGGVAPPGDAAVTGDSAAEAPSSVPVRCEVVSQSPCMDNEQCNAFCEDMHLVIGCRAEPVVAGAVGAACSGPMPCSRGTTCLAVTGKSAVCMKLCAVTADCPMGTGCRDVRAAFACSAGGSETVMLRTCM